MTASTSAFFSLMELTFRWECPMHRVVDAAILEQLRVVAGIPPVICGHQRIGGLV